MFRLVVLAIVLSVVVVFAGGPQHEESSTELPTTLKPPCPLCSDVKARTVDLIATHYLDYINKIYPCDPGLATVSYYNNELVSQIKGICAGDYFTS
jgi:hypothetical protein